MVKLELIQKTEEMERFTFGHQAQYNQDIIKGKMQSESDVHCQLQGKFSETTTEIANHGSG